MLPVNKKNKGHKLLIMDTSADNLSATSYNIYEYGCKVGYSSK